MERQRVAVVTGASGGIGSATVSAFDDAGWIAIGVDRQDKLPHSAAKLFVTADISNAEQVGRVFEEIIAAGYARIDALVNNAAVQVAKPLIDTSPDEWDMIMASNVRSVYLASRAGYPLMYDGGAIVNVSSVHAIATSKGIAAYAASKGALLALTRAMALEMASDGIRVNAILPGAVDTRMLRDGLARRPEDGDGQAAIRALGTRTPIGRVADPQEIAEAILFLADSTRSSFVVGQALVVDGGATTRLSTE